MRLVVIQHYPDAAVLGQKLAQQHQSRIHHAQPLAVLQPVVVVLKGALRVVGRVDKYALHLPPIKRKQRFQCEQVVTLYQKIVSKTTVYNAMCADLAQ